MEELKPQIEKWFAENCDYVVRVKEGEDNQGYVVVVSKGSRYVAFKIAPEAIETPGAMQPFLDKCNETFQKAYKEKAI